MAAGEQYKQHKSELLNREIAASSFTPAISATSRKLAGQLPPLHRRAVELAREREARLQLEMRRQDERMRQISSVVRKVTEEDAARKAQAFAQWEERKKLRIEETKKKIEASEAAVCTFKPNVKSVRGKENSCSFEQRMQEDAARRSERMERLKQSTEERELKECRFKPAGKTEKTRPPLQPLNQIQSMSLDEIFSLVK
jgi:hypothetical protein